MKFSIGLVCQIVVGFSFVLAASAQQPLDEWKLRLSVGPEQGQFPGIGRKVAIVGDEVVIGTGRGNHILLVDAGSDEIFNTIIDPIANCGGASANLTEEESFGYAVGIAVTSGGIKVVVGDTEHDKDVNGMLPEFPLYLSSVGQAHIYTLSLTGTVTNRQDIYSPELPTPFQLGTETFSSGAQFGHDVALSGNWFAVGAPFSDPDGLGVDFFERIVGSGSAFLYDTNALNQPIELIDPSRNWGDKFGAYMAISNGLVTTSDHCDGEGAVHVYDTSMVSSGVTFLNPAFSAIEPVNKIYKEFGWDTDMHNDLLLVGHNYGASLYRLTPTSATYLFTISSIEKTFGRVVAFDGDRIAIGQQGIEVVGGGAVIVEGFVEVYDYDATAGTYVDDPERIYDPTVSANGGEIFPTGLDMAGDLLVIGSNRQNPPTGGLYGGEALIYEFGIVLGDVNQDGTLNLLDVAPFVAVLNSGIYQVEADMDCNGVVDLLDVAPFVDALNGN